MTIGHRVFVIAADNNIRSISQKSYERFYLRGEPSLPSFAGSDIHIAVVFYTIANRKPHQIIRMDNPPLNTVRHGLWVYVYCTVIVSAWCIDN